MYSTEVPQQVRTRMALLGRGRTVTCGHGRRWTWCLLFASRGSGVRVPLAPLPDSWYLARSEALSTGSTLVGRVEPFEYLGGIWEIIFSLPPRAGASCGVLCGVSCGAGSRFPPRSGASSSSSSGMGERGQMAARSRRESSQRAWSACFRSSHPRGGVGVEATHPGHFVAEALLGEDLGDAVFGHPCLVAVPEAVHGQAGLDREPAGERRVI
jgi:hypothetical protein